MLAIKLYNVFGYWNKRWFKDKYFDGEFTYNGYRYLPLDKVDGQYWYDDKDIEVLEIDYK